ncbi:MAG TPA: flippase [Acidimicrobiia bacterium]|jgi:O-antigen/teichoic acid export membrane protein
MKPDRTPRQSGTILGGAGVLVVGRNVVAALGWLGTVIIVRQLSQQEWGQYSLIVSLLGIIGFIADLRLSRIVLRDVMGAGHEIAGEVVGSYVGLRLVIGLVSYLIALAWVLLGSYSRDVVLGTAVMGLNLVILSAAFGVTLLFEARLWLRDVAFGNALGQLVQFATTVAIAFAGVASILWFSWATVINSIVVVAWLAFVAHRTTRLRFRLQWSQWWLWMREAAPLALGSALDTIYFRIDVVMLAALSTYTAVGTYSVGYKFSDLLGAVPLAVITPALTLMVAAWPHDVPAFRRTFRHSLIILTVGSLGACAGFLVFAGPLVSALYTERYAHAANSARLLVVGQGLHFFTLLAFTTLVAVGRNKLYPIAMLVGVVVNVALNLILIPRYSYIGSGWATVVTEVLVLIVLTIGVLRIPGVRPLPWVPIAKCAVAATTAGLVGWALLGRIPWPVAGLVTGLVYLGVVHVIRVDGPGGLRVLAGEGRDDRPVASGPADGPTPRDPESAG